MNHFTTDLVEALVTKQDITKVFRSHLESASYESSARNGINSLFGL